LACRLNPRHTGALAPSDALRAPNFSSAALASNCVEHRNCGRFCLQQPASNPTQEEYPAVMLATAPDMNGEIDLLLRARSFTNQRFDLTQGKHYHLMPSKLVEVGDNLTWRGSKS
jgi:hypothetical protein